MSLSPPPSSYSIGGGNSGMMNGNGSNGANGGSAQFTGHPVFVYHLPLDVVESTLQDLFRRFGEVTHAKVMRDLQSGRSKGFGFVNMKSLAEADEAIKGLNGYQIGGKYLKVAHKK